MNRRSEMNQRTVELTRLIDAPRERVFAAWTQAKHFEHWFGPKGFTLHSCEADPRPGGIFRLCMRAPWGEEYWVRGSYLEVVAPERLVITCTADDEKGIARLEEIIKVTFTERAGKTTLKVHAVASGPSDKAAGMLKGMQQGWAETVDRLGAHLATKS